MELKNAFDVPAPPERVWAFLLDVERVIPCMPGAELTEVIDDKNWKGKVTIKLGPVKMSFAGTVVMEERDDTAKRVVLRGKGTEASGKGMVAAVVTSQVTAAGTGAHVDILTDLKISGPAAQYGRGMIADVSELFTKQFASAMAARLVDNAPSNEPVPEGRASAVQVPDGAPDASSMPSNSASATAGSVPERMGVAASPGTAAGLPTSTVPRLPASTVPRASAPPSVKPISGFSLAWFALSRAFIRSFNRIWAALTGKSRDAV